ncbi:MAG: RNA pseudouridine synthase [Planctomycetota bacterium]|nr:RNA pseudouridine synthase [Planctomycetota bacterium]
MLIDQTRLNLRVLSQSPSDLVVVKPAGMATELTRDPKRSALISHIRAAAAEGVQPRLVHRLDRITRGVVVVALTREAAAFYGEQIREGVWEKYYLARIPTPDPRTNPLHQGLIGRHKAYIKEHEKHASLVRSGGKTSFLEILAIEPAPGRQGQSHALIRLLTGRLHQIRVMFAGLGLPLVGDDVYGGSLDEGPVFLEHTALWYVDAHTRELRLAHDPHDPEREPLAPALRTALRAVLRL